MPRMTGLEFYDRLLEAKPQFNGHFVFMSGDLMSRDCRQKVMKTARPFLEKPFLPQELLRLVPLAS